MNNKCVVCCCGFNNDLFSRINIESSEWNEWNIRRVIEKHLWWWYLRPSNTDAVQWICRQCWQELSSFHNFYLRVEKEHKEYVLTMPAIKCDKDDATIAIKEEEVQVLENESLLNESLVNLQKPKRGRRKQICDNASIPIEELCVVEVKCENELTASMEVPKSEMEDSTIDDVDNWEEPCFNNEIESDETEEENCLDETKDEDISKLDLKTVETERKLKTKSVAKCRKKLTKPKKEPKTKDVKDSSRTQAIKRNDDFLANNFGLSCSICNVPLSDFSNLKVHFRKKHNILGYAMCCNKKFYKRCVLVDHLSLHNDPNYFKCLQCNKALSSRFSYDKHMKTHQLYEFAQITYTCHMCDKSFLKKEVFDRHLLTHVPEDERNFQCNVCPKKFASQYLLRQHMSITHAKKYAKICDICGKSFRDGFSFMRHMDEHNGVPVVKVPCDICGAEITNKYLLNHHKKMMHTEENQQEKICPYCSKVSPNVNAHRRHIMYTHTLERKHACNMCDKKFRRPLELREHLSTHTGEPLYTCPHCPRTFISNANMHKHRKLSHRKEWEEGRRKKPAPHLKTLISKKMSNDLDAPNREATYPEISIVNSTETVPNLSTLKF